MPSATENTTAQPRKAPPVAISQPVRASPRRSREPTRIATAADQREAEQPARLGAERGVEQAERADRAAEHAADPPPPPGPPMAPPGPPAWPVTRPGAVVAGDQRPDRVVGRAGDPRPRLGRRQRDQQRPCATDHHHRQPAGGQLPHAGEAAARRGPQPRRRQPRHDDQRRGHLRLEAEADHHARQHEPARAPVGQPAHDEPQRRHAAAARAACPGCCGARSRPRSASARARARRRSPPAGPTRAASGHRRARPPRRP